MNSEAVSDLACFAVDVATDSETEEDADHVSELLIRVEPFLTDKAMIGIGESINWFILCHEDPQHDDVIFIWRDFLNMWITLMHKRNLWIHTHASE